MRIHTIFLPDLTPDGAPSSVESLLSEANNAPDSDGYAFDFKSQSYICPYGVLAVLHIARMLSTRSGRPVDIVGVPKDVHSYLHRVGLFEKGFLWLNCSQTLEKGWNRISNSPNVLDIAFIQDRADVISTIKLAENIFARWLPDDEVEFLTSMMSEVCTNIYKHSTDENGCVIAQKYEIGTDSYVKVCVGVADMGIGIRQSLSQMHTSLPIKESACLEAAVAGLSSRGVGQTGTGLGSAVEIARRNGGHLSLRSHTGRLILLPGKTIKQDNRPFFGGTQLAIEFRAPL